MYNNAVGAGFDTCANQYVNKKNTYDNERSSDFLLVDGIFFFQFFISGCIWR